MNQHVAEQWEQDVLQRHIHAYARQLARERQQEGLARRHYAEAMRFYQSEEWTTMNIKSETIDKLLHHLLSNFETHQANRAATQDRLDELIRADTQRSFESITLRREALLTATERTMQHELMGPNEPSPLDQFLTAYRRITAELEHEQNLARDDEDIPHHKPRRRR